MALQTIQFFSPAKINVFFRVLKKREDGFHEIVSLCHALGIGDILSFCNSNRDAFSTNHSSLPLDESNLVKKALAKFREKTQMHTPIAIHLEKHIPLQSGLGGGSSNAATTLHGLRQIFAPRISDRTLMSWGKEIGSDVAFFFSSGCAYCSGRGEKVTSMPWSLDHSLWIAKPSFGLSTPAVYKACRPGPDIQIDIAAFKAGDFTQIVNDLEPAAFSLNPSLISIKKKLYDLGFEKVQMTGSGTAFFCFGTPRKNDPLLFSETTFIAREKNQWYLSPKKIKLKQ